MRWVHARTIDSNAEVRIGYCQQRRKPRFFWITIPDKAFS
jgi:hypothetical protein